MQNINLSFILLLFCIFIGMIRLFKNLVGLVLLILPPLLLSIYLKYSFNIVLICWLVLLDYISTNRDIIYDLFIYAFIHHHRYKFGILGKITNILVRCGSLIVTTFIYIYLLFGLISQKDFISLLTVATYSYIAISLVKLLCNSILKLKLLRIKKR